MRKLLGLLAGIGLAASVAVPAQAALLQSASLQVVIGTLPTIPVAWNNTGSADVTGASISNLTAGIFNFSGVLPVTDAAAFPITGLSIDGATNGVGNFTFDEIGNGGGTMAVQGLLNLCLFVPCSAPPPANVTVPFTTGGVNGIGLGGSVIVESGLVNVHLPGNTWTTGTASIGAPSIDTISQTGTAFDGTTVKLVTPAMISSSIGASAVIPVFATLTLTFIPEPGTALLLAAGAAGLAVLGRRRMSRYSSGWIRSGPADRATNSSTTAATPHRDITGTPVEGMEKEPMEHERRMTLGQRSLREARLSLGGRTATRRSSDVADPS